jgi:hypothetical protein
MDELVEDVQALDSAGEAWGTKASEPVHKVRHHLQQESPARAESDAHTVSRSGVRRTWLPFSTK